MRLIGRAGNRDYDTFRPSPALEGTLRTPRPGLRDVLQLAGWIHVNTGFLGFALEKHVSGAT